MYIYIYIYIYISENTYNYIPSELTDCDLALLKVPNLSFTVA